MTTVLLDTHAYHWATSEPGKLGKTAAALVTDADELAVAAMTWYELAWLAEHRRIVVPMPVRSWLDKLAANVRTIPITASIAHTAVTLPADFPGDPADRLIFATAVEHGWPLVTKDKRIRRYRGARGVAVW